MRIESATIPKSIYIIISFTIVFSGLYVSSLYSYLLFHSLAELFSVIVACGIFMVAWNSRRFLDNNYLLFIGLAYLFIGGIDLVHTLAYKGMGIFKGHGPNLPTQLWISARYMESISLVIAPFLFNRNLKITLIFTAYALATFLLFMTIFLWGVFPDCFVEDQGLTYFKKISEYIISLILLSSIIFLNKKRNEFDPNIFKLLVASIIVTIGAELAFTFYVSVFGLSNLIGHFLKIISFFLIYKALIETGLSRPYDLLFRNLKKSEEELRKERNNLQNALDEIKKLQGILPICSSCKKIRNDKGDWTQIEEYIRDHSEAEFSHGMCPECIKKHYPFLKNR